MTTDIADQPTEKPARDADIADDGSSNVVAWATEPRDTPFFVAVGYLLVGIMIGVCVWQAVVALQANDPAERIGAWWALAFAVIALFIMTLLSRSRSSTSIDDDSADDGPADGLDP